MIGWTILALCARAAPLALDRVDLLAEAPGTWLPHEAPRLLTAPRPAALRWLAQVSPTVSTGPLQISASLSAQSVALVRPLARAPGLSAEIGLIGRGFLPVGLRAGLSLRPGPIRLGLSLVALSDATWVRPSYRSWTVLPAVGFGIGRARGPRAPWME